MATYTMQLKTYIEQFSQFEEGLTTSQKIERGRKHLFDFYYPIYDEDYRKIFETNLIRKFYIREIGFETEELFKFQLESWLQINMPYYNEMFKSELFDYDPLMNSQMIVAHDKANKRDQQDGRKISQTSETDGLNTGHSTQIYAGNSQSVDDNFNRKVGSDNPDSRLALTTQQGKGVIEYASNIDESKTDNKSNSTSNSTSTGNTEDNTHVESKADQSDDLERNINETEHFIERRFGKVGIQSYPELIREYRNSLLRVEVMIHKEIQELFMLVY